jgi:hypothetical protein
MDELTSGHKEMPQTDEENQSMGGAGSSPGDYEDLAIDHALWSLLVQLSRKLQISSASIKAGVSSMLDYNIFWDGSAQYEFLESINASTDQVSRMVMLLSLVTRAKSGSLEMKVEPQMLQEIVSVVREQFRRGSYGLSIEVTLPNTGRPVLVDYEYLMLGLRFLVEVLGSTISEPEALQIFAFETIEGWKMDIVSKISIIKPFTFLEKEKILEMLNASMQNAENRLKLYIIYRIFLQLNITVEYIEYAEQKAGLRLHVPGTPFDEPAEK